MDERRVQVFLQNISHYLKQTTDRELSVGTPYLSDNRSPEAYDFTGIINISGSQRGCVYFTAPQAMLKHMLLALGESDLGSRNLRDLVGEVANTLSGNARREFGERFMISVPQVVGGRPDLKLLPLDLRSYVIPIFCKRYQAAVVVGLDI